MRNPFKRRQQAEKAIAPEGAKATTPDGLRVVQFSGPIQNLVRMYGFGTSYSAMYARQPHIRTAVETVAREAAELNLKMFERMPRPPVAIEDFLQQVPSGRVDITGDHRMMDLLREPTPRHSTYRFWYDTFADIEVFDIAYWLKVYNGRSYPSALLRVPPSSLVPNYDPYTNQIRSWRDETGRVYTTDDLVVFWGYDPNANLSNIPPMETLRRLIADAVAAEANREGMWANSLRKDGIIERAVDAPAMSDEARESFLLDAEDALAGADGTSSPFMLEPGMKWIDVQWSPRELEWLDARKLGRREVAAAFHLPGDMVLAGDKDPDRNTLQYFYMSSLPPRLRRVESEIQAQLLPEFDLVSSVRKQRYVEFNLDAKLRGSFEEQAAVMATTAGGPVITVNEARARLNLPPIPGGDLIFVPLNSVRGGGPQGSPQNPTDVPGEGVNPAGTTPGGGVQRAVAGEESIAIGAAAAVGDFERELQLRMKKVEDDAKNAKDAAEHAAFQREKRARYEDRFVRMFDHYFERQKNLTRVNRDLNMTRWNQELTDDLVGVTLQLVEVFGEEAAKQIKGGWSTDQTIGYIRARSADRAQNINEDIQKRLETDADIDDIYTDEKANQLAMQAVTYWMNWSTMEAAHQNGEV